MIQQGSPRDSLVEYDIALELGQSHAAGRLVSSDPKKLQTSIKAQVNKKVDIPYAGAKPTTEDILHAILPPKEWVEENGSHYIKYVSSKSATRNDVAKLSEALGARLMERQARETGICPVREELYAQCFDELIRQVTLDCPERGLLLLRIRDEIRMTIAAYQTLYNSSVTFGTRKQLQAERGKAEVEQMITDLKTEKTQLEGKVSEMRSRVEAIRRREEEREQFERKKKQEEAEFLQTQIGHLETFLKSVSES